MTLSFFKERFVIRAKGFQGPGAKPASRQGRDWNHKALVSLGVGGEDTLRLLWRKRGLFFGVKVKPDRCFRRVPAWPPGPNRGLATIFSRL